jgi:hypothetical protein
MFFGNRRENVGKWFQEENDDVWQLDREYIDVQGRNLEMEGTRRGREKIFERGARSGQRNAIVRKAGKRAAKFEDKMDGREESRILTEC